MASDVPMPESMTEEAMANWLDDNDTDGERSVASYLTLARAVLALVENKCRLMYDVARDGRGDNMDVAVARVFGREVRRG